MKRLFIFLALLISTFNLFSQIPHIVMPSLTDPLCTGHEYNHFAYYNSTITQKNKLFLFFPGTGGVPFNQRELLKHAANLGYHTIGLSYPNIKAVNEFCINSGDTTCHSRGRLEVFDGINRHDSIQVDSNNCIRNRTIKLLQYLHTNYPSENWGQYFSGNQIIWNKIMVSGHSQGGSHAGIISKIKQVDRVIMFAATDWLAPPLGRLADWVTWNGPTHPSAYYGFIHEQDDGIPFTLAEHTWQTYGMNVYGSSVLSDTAFPPYNNTRQLFTRLTPSTDTTKYHGCIVADIYLPRTGGVIDYLNVWTYLIDSPNYASLAEEKNSFKPSLFPNPSVNQVFIEGIDLAKYQISIYSIDGKNQSDWKISSNHINVSKLNSGVYFILIANDQQQFSYKFIKN